MTGPRYTKIAQSLPATVPFVGPESQERQRARPFRARIGANESVFGPSPNAVTAMQKAARNLWQYGDPENYDLKMALAAHLGTSPETITIGEGIDGLLGVLARLFIEPGDAVVTSDGAYPTFNYHVTGFGGVLHKVPYRDDKEDIEALIDAAQRTGAKLVYLANPDNPMGTYSSGVTIAMALAKLPADCLLILDEAYIECAPQDAAVPLPFDDPRLIRMRTFSKVYGLAGARIGYALAAPELISAFNKVRNHFGVNRLAQTGALAALEDQDWLSYVQSEIAMSRRLLATIALENGLTSLPSAANFVTIDCGRDGDFAKSVLNALIELDIFVRMPFSAPQNRCIRISCGQAEDLLAVAECLPKALAKARA